MFDLSIKDSANHLLKRLITRAERHGRSVDDEAREILREAVKDEVPTRKKQMSGKEFYEGIRAIVERNGGYDLELPPRDQSMREPPRFE